MDGALMTTGGQMSDDHDVRNECAVRFERLDGNIRKLENGKRETSEAMRDLADSMKAVANSNRSNHDETTRMITGFQAQLIEMFSSTSERMAIVEQQSRSAHHRIDQQQVDAATWKTELQDSIKDTRKLLWALLVLAVTMTGGALLTAIIDHSVGG